MHAPTVDIQNNIVSVILVLVDVWHSPHPPFFIVLFKVCVFNVLMCFILISSFCLLLEDIIA